MKTLSAIMCHREVQDTVFRHLRYWSQHGDVILVCPYNSVIECQLPILSMEPSMHHGVEINRKFRRLLQFLPRMAYDRFIIHEYDSFCLDKNAPDDLDPEMLYGNLFTSDQKEFQGHYFLHPPITICRELLEARLLPYIGTVPDETDYFWDRWLGYVCEYGKIPFRGYPNGFAANTIEIHAIPQAVEARKNGASWFHGVKAGAVLDAITAAVEQKCSTDL